MKSIPSADWQQAHYKRMVAHKIHERYSVDDEIALLRQKDAKPEEYEAYVKYADGCKETVKKLVAREN